MDAEHQKFMLSTGFDKFWRGKNQKERMLVTVTVLIGALAANPTCLGRIFWVTEFSTEMMRYALKHVSKNV